MLLALGHGRHQITRLFGWPLCLVKIGYLDHGKLSRVPIYKKKYIVMQTHAVKGQQSDCAGVLTGALRHLPMRAGCVVGSMEKATSRPRTDLSITGHNKGESREVFLTTAYNLVIQTHAV